MTNKITPNNNSQPCVFNEQEFVDFCVSGNLQEVVRLYELGGVDLEYQQSYFFRSACAAGSVEVVRYLVDCAKLIDSNNEIVLTKGDGGQKLNETENVLHRMICSFCHQGFFNACKNNHITVVDYLLDVYRQSGVEITDRVIKAGFSAAVTHEHLELIDFLMDNADTKDIVGEKEYLGEMFGLSCNQSKVSSLRHLVLKRRILERLNIDFGGDLRFSMDELFVYCDTLEYIDVVKFLIFEVNIPQTLFINGHLMLNQKKEILDWFSIRDVKNKLLTSLDVQSVKNTASEDSEGCERKSNALNGVFKL